MLLDDADRALFVAGEDAAAELRLAVTRQGDQAFGELGERGAADAGNEVEPLEVADRHQLHEVVEPGQVLGQERQVVVTVALLLVVVVPLRDVDLAAEDRGDLLAASRLVELDRPEQVAAVGERDAVLSIVRSRLAERADVGVARQDAVVTMTVKVREADHVADTPPAAIPDDRKPQSNAVGVARNAKAAAVNSARKDASMIGTCSSAGTSTTSLDSSSTANA